MKYDLDNILKEKFNNDNEVTPENALNLETVQKMKECYNGHNENGGVGVNRFLQLTVLSVCLCFFIAVSVPAFSAITTYVKKIVNNENKAVREKETTSYLEVDNLKVEYKVEDVTITVFGEGMMEFDLCEDLEKYKEVIKKVVICEGVTSVGQGAFEGFGCLESVEIAESVTVIEGTAFKDCVNLKEIVIPEGVKEIESFAFSGCTNLEVVSLPCTIEKISLDSFESTKWMDNLKEDENGLIVVSDFLISGLNAKGTVIIPDNVKVIADYAFYLSEIENVIIPDGVTGIGYCAFGKCFKLKELNIPGSAKFIDSATFTKCESLEKVTIDKGITSIKRNAFEYCSSLEYIEIPEGVEYIGDSAFSECTNLKSIKLPESLNSVGYSIFYNDDALEIIYGVEGSFGEELAIYGDYMFLAE